MSDHHVISATHLSIKDIADILYNNKKLVLSDQSRAAIAQCADYLSHTLAEKSGTFYGINTGFGSLCHIRISDGEISDLQHNLVRSHACGLGEHVPHKVVKIMLLLKIQGLSYGYSGVRVETVERLIRFFNDGVWPEIFQLGSLGASGDLAPLAHLSLPLIGEGSVFYQDKYVPTAQYLAEQGLEPLRLSAKEGLALLNGTQFSAAYGLYCLIEGERLWTQTTLNAALSIDAFDCRLEPFDARLHQIRPHQGQIKTAAAVRQYLTDSPLSAQPKTAVQDPYAFRCVPQVHGASADVLAHVAQVFTTEINAVTDNPTVFAADEAILSGGNFHAQPLALALDYLALALAELGNIAERRVYQLISGQRGLPVYLTENGGLESGMMIAQYTAASIVSQNKQLCSPASIDSIVSSNGQEDHVSMAANAATKCLRVVENFERLCAIEWMVAAQAIDLRRPLKTSPFLEEMHQKYREKVPVLRGDRILSIDMHDTIDFWRSQSWPFESLIMSK